MLANAIYYIILILQDLIGLIFFPYRQMRRITLSASEELFYFFSVLAFVFFILQEKIKPLSFNGFIIFLLFIFNLFLTISFFYFLLKIFNSRLSFRSLFSAYSATLFPTVVFFFFNIFSFLLFPPPRSYSILGFAFSYFYLTVVLLLVFWKLILVYLALRFSAGVSFSKIIFVMILYISVFSVYYVFLYNIGLIRLPFI